MRKWGCAVAGLMVGAMPALAQAQEQVPGTTAPADAPVHPADTAGPAVEEPVDDAVEEEGIQEVVVTGTVRGAVPGDIKPEQQLGPSEIRAYGASSVSELIDQLSAQLGTGQGRGGERPVVLLSGRRSSFSEVRDIPPEALERVDILPEEVALKYGFAATQKVINFVLRPRFAALSTEIEGRMPTAGGNAGGRGEAKVDVIRRNERINLTVQYDQSSGILESERGVSRSDGSLFDLRGNITGIGGGEVDPALSALAGGPIGIVGVPDAAAGGPLGLGAFAPGAGRANVTDLTDLRTLVNPRKNLSIGGVYSRPLSEKIRASANFRVEGTESSALLGLPSYALRLPAGSPYSPFGQDVQLLRYYDGGSPLTRASSSRAYHGELTVNGDGTPWADSWRWSLNAQYNVSTSDATTDRGIDPSGLQALLDARSPAFNPFGPLVPSLVSYRPDDTSHSRNGDARIDLLTNGALFKLPAGDVNASIRVSGRFQDLSSESFRNGVARTADISRDTGSIRANLDLPIASRRREVLSAIGDLSLNANFEAEELSDFGRLTSTGYGFNWSPIEPIRAIVSWTRDSNAPSPGNLGDPLLVTPNVRVFDYVRGQSVEVSSITGGNPLLSADTRRVFKLGVNVRPLKETNLNLIANYTNQRYRNTTGSLPGATAEVEAAFPDRFVRDPDGRLTSIDLRPINFARYDRKELRWGFNLFLPIESPAQKRQQARFAQVRTAMQEARRTGQPLPPELSAQVEQFRKLGQQPSLFGGNQRGGGRRGEGGRGANQPQGEATPPATTGQAPAPGATTPPAQAQAPDTAAAARPRGGPGGFGGRGGFGGGRGGPGGRGGGNVVQFSLYHTWVFQDERLIREGLPVLDYLNGAAASNLSGGTPAHSIQFQTGVQRDGLRLRLEGNWESGSTVATGTLGSGDTLDFGSLTRFNLVAQADLGQQPDLLLKHPWLRGTRVSLRVDNLFDARRRVTDEAGIVPNAYQPNLLDPTGRTVRLTLRKLFF